MSDYDYDDEDEDEDPMKPVAHRRSNYFVALYVCNRSMYSQAEGGCWYTYGDRDVERRVWVFRNEKHAYDFAFRFNERLRAWQKKTRQFPISSMACQGVHQAHVYRDNLPNHFPDRVPVYE
jgi:hypothetical protein